LAAVGETADTKLTTISNTVPLIIVYSGENFETRKWAKYLGVSVQSQGHSFRGVSFSPDGLKIVTHTYKEIGNRE
jgi:hypothetical protein